MEWGAGRVPASVGRRIAFVVALLAVAALVIAGVAVAAACPPTPPDMEGPFYVPGAPERSSTGRGLVVEGRLLSAGGCRPLPGGRIEWWHAGPSGEYLDRYRGATRSGPGGAYRFSTDPPGLYPGRPLHVHVKAFAPGHRTLTTQIYLKPGDKRIRFDLVLSPAGR